MNYDECQIKAIESLDNTLVIAGAGSGKTSTIVGKISYLLENNIYNSEDILIISFTNESVNLLKKKINYNVSIKTFHKLALDIINTQKLKININNNYLSYIINEYFYSYAMQQNSIRNSYLRIIKKCSKEKLNKLIETFINIYKCNFESIDNLYFLYKKSFFTNKVYYKFILDIYLIYQRELESTFSLDLNDLIITATKMINANKRKTAYKFIIIDEFQDSSLIRFNLIRSIINQNEGKIFVVGDDYQSIYRFSGCNLNLFINFTDFFSDTKIMHLSHNYRNSTELINIANNFIMKNKKQIEKETICHKNIVKPIKIVFYVDKQKVVNKVIKIIKGNILILARNNRDKVLFSIKEDERTHFLTIHKSKGLEEENIILINLENSPLGFPSKIKNEKIISQLLKTEYIIHEEERRLFYVALTRAKNYVYLLVPKYNQSIFIKELIKDNKENIEFIHIN